MHASWPLSLHAGGLANTVRRRGVREHVNRAERAKGRELYSNSGGSSTLLSMAARASREHALAVWVSRPGIFSTCRAMWRRVCSVERAHYKRDLELGALDLAGGHHHEVARAARHGQRVSIASRAVCRLRGGGVVSSTRWRHHACPFPPRDPAQWLHVSTRGLWRRPWLRFPPSPFNFEKERSFDTKSCYVSQPSLQRQYR